MQSVKTAEEIAPFVVSNEVLDDAEELRARMARDGYLFLRGLIFGEAIEAARQDILRLCAEAGWLAPGTDIGEAIAAPGVQHIEPEPAFMAVYNRLQKSEAFHALALDSGLMSLLRTLFGEEPLAHARNIARIIFPQNTLHTTPAHQDYLHIQGTPATYTAWIPLGDCPMSLGSLVVMPGSHRAGLLDVHSAYGAGGVGIETDALPYTWAGGDFAKGDAILFHSLTVHKALPNLSPDRIRLSVDYRYQPLSHPVDASSFLPHHNQTTWEAIYADWKSETNKYYWNALPLRYADHDPRVREIRSAAKPNPIARP